MTLLNLTSVFCVSLCVLGLHVPARGVLTELLCARCSDSCLEPEKVDGPGLLSMATSDTVNIQYNDQLKTTMRQNAQNVIYDLVNKKQSRTLEA